MGIEGEGKMNVKVAKVIEQFEEEVAKYAGAKFGVAVSSNTNGIFLCLELLKHVKEIKEGDIIQIPKQTYMSIPMSILNAKCKIKFDDRKWSGAYQLKPTVIWDAAVRFAKDMYVDGSLYVLSFQYRKTLPLGRGGMILTDDVHYRHLLQKLRFNGRALGVSQADDEYNMRGWNMYLLPEQAARGLTLMTLIPEKNKDIASYQDYPDLSNQRLFNE
jgi:dTDP-4-amino-4,6-dideoxygalactose transaminase